MRNEIRQTEISDTEDSRFALNTGPHGELVAVISIQANNVRSFSSRTLSVRCTHLMRAFHKRVCSGPTARGY